MHVPPIPSAAGVLAAVLLCCGVPARAEILLSEDFETNDSRAALEAAGWDLINLVAPAATAPGPSYNFVTGNGSATALSTGDIGASSPQSNNRPGGFFLAPVVVDADRGFRLTYDLLFTDGDQPASAFNDAVTVLGYTGEVAFDYAVTTAAAANNDLWRVTGTADGARTELVGNYGAGFLNNTFYGVTIDWAPLTGNTGTLSVAFTGTGVDAADGFTLANYTLADNSRFGFGTFNNVGTFDNVVFNAAPVPVPEPGGGVLVLLAACGCLVRRRPATGTAG